MVQIVMEADHSRAIKELFGLTRFTNCAYEKPWILIAWIRWLWLHSKVEESLTSPHS